MPKKLSEKLSKKVPAKSGTIKTNILLGSLTNRGGGRGLPPKSGRGGLLTFGSLFVKNQSNILVFMVLDVARTFCDNFLNTF